MTKTISSNTRLLNLLAWLNVVLHVIGLVFVVIGMRAGTPLVALQDRINYLAGFPLGWSLGWGIWMLCAIALLAFCSVLADHLPEHHVTARLAVIIATAGVAIDIFCDVVLITVLPMVASWGDQDTRLFLTLERMTSAGGLIGANGFYSIAVLILTLCLRKRSIIAWLGYGVFLFGMLMVVAGFTGDQKLLQLATGPTIGLFCAWTVFAARSFKAARR